MLEDHQPLFLAAALVYLSKEDRAVVASLNSVLQGSDRSGSAAEVAEAWCSSLRRVRPRWGVGALSRQVLVPETSSESEADSVGDWWATGFAFECRSGDEDGYVPFEHSDPLDEHSRSWSSGDSS